MAESDILQMRKQEKNNKVTVKRSRAVQRENHAAAKMTRFYDSLPARDSYHKVILNHNEAGRHGRDELRVMETRNRT